MQRYIWFEWPATAELMSVIHGVAEPLGPALDTPDDPFRAIRPAHGAIAVSLAYNAAVMDLAPELLVISRTGIGYDNVDVAEATKRGIAVCNTPDAPTISTAEHALALMLGVAKKIKLAEHDLHNMNGRTDYARTHAGLELYGRTLGLVGLGRIGRHLAKIALALGMTVLTYDPFIADSVAAELGVTRVSTLAELLSGADVVSLHLPLTPETRGLMNAERFAQMRPGAVFINTARGGIVDEQALLAALDSGHLAGAGLDVTNPEPPHMDNPLVHRNDVVITPHIASGTSVGKHRIWSTAIQQVVDVLQGKRPAHLVNPDVWPNVLERWQAQNG